MTGMPGAGADIVGIEQEGVVGVKRLVSRAVFAEQELLEEPGGMGAVPFRRAGVRHRLDQLILGRQRARRGARSRFGPQETLPPNSGRGCRNRKIVTGQGVASAADAGFVTVVSGSGENVGLAEGFPENSPS